MLEKVKALDLVQVSKFYGSIRALNEVSFSVDQGEIVALLGCNGAGKSTLVNIAAGLLQPTSGTSTVFGHKSSAQNAKEGRRVLPQDLSFPKHLKVREILEVVYSHYEKSSYTEIADEIGLTPLFGRLTTDLSGGEKRKLAFMCSLAGDPALVLMDEPTANVDLIGQESIRRVIKRLFTGKSSLVFSSHYMNEVEELADRVVVLDGGEIVFNGAIDQIKTLLGEKKVCFRPSRDLSHFKFAGASKLNMKNDVVEIHGPSSDRLLKEIIQQDPGATEIQIELPTLEESILKIWDSRKRVAP